MSQRTAQLDSTIEIVTPENIAFHYHVAGPFRRLPAYLIDVVVRVGITFLLAILLSISAIIIGGISVGLLLVLMFILEWFYGGLFETFMNGQTPGKWIFGIRTLTRDGQPINGLQAVMRNVLRVVDLWPLVSIQVFGMPARVFLGESLPEYYLFPTGLVGLTAMMLNQRFQRLGDLVCGTMVVVEQRQWFTGLAKLEDPRVVQLASILPADFRINRSLAQALAVYVERRKNFDIPRRREIARHLAMPLLKKFDLPADTSHDLLLCALYYRAFIADQKDDERQAAQWGKSPFGIQAMQPAASPSPVAPLPSSGPQTVVAADSQAAAPGSQVQP